MRSSSLLFCSAAAFAMAIYGEEDAPPKSGKAIPPATFENVKYGAYERNVLDFWQAKSAHPTPLVIFIHGGGFTSGDKRESLDGEQVQKCLNAGFSFASINYRFSQHAIYPAPMLDGARAIQFLKHKAKEWNIDPERVASTGGSAGGGMSLWIGFHDDLADPKSADPIARQSTRLACMAVTNTQSSYDPRFLKKLIPGEAYRHPALIKLFGLKPGEIDQPPPEKIKLFEDSAAINHASAGDPPVYMKYGENVALTPSSSAGTGIHHVNLGLALKEKLDALKVECVVRYKGDNAGADGNMAFLMKHLGKK